MSAISTLWISEADVVSLMDMKSAIVALKHGLHLEAGGQALNMIKTHISWGKGSTLHAIGAVFSDAGFAGTKTWAHTSAGAKPLLILFDSNTGALLAVMEAFTLGKLRTGGVSGLATEQLGSPDACEFAIIGTGKQAMMQVLGVLTAREIKKVHVFGRNKERRDQFAARVQKECGVETIPENTIADAVRSASIITVVTRATEPILEASMIAPGTHINAVGAIVPGRFELAESVLERADMIVVDSVSQARELSSELIGFYDEDEAGWAKVVSLSAIVESGEKRSRNADLTIFKSLGMGISDLSLAVEIYQKALTRGMGQSLASVGRADGA
jgi:alanine dehydrogenase